MIAPLLLNGERARKAMSTRIAAQYWVCNAAKLCIAFAHAYVVCPPVLPLKPVMRKMVSMRSFLRTWSMLEG